MAWFKKNKWKLLIGAAAAAALVLAFVLGGGSGRTAAPETDAAQAQSAQTEESAGVAAARTETSARETSAGAAGGATSASEALSEQPETSAQASPGSAETSAESSAETSAGTGGAQAAPPSAPAAQETSGGGETDAEKTPTCTVSISCATLLSHIGELESAKQGLVPSDGVLLSETEVSLSEGESVFDVLREVTREKGIQMEFSNSPVYQSAYIEGIGNLYEFDAGSLSGWVYSVNGSFPHYGSSKVTVSDGDVIRWLYTCDLGADVGGYNYGS